MNNYNVSAIKFFFQELPQPFTCRIQAHVEIRKRMTKGGRRLGYGAITFGSEIPHRPSIAFFVATDFMPKSHEGARQTAQKVGIAMVPVGNPRVRKEAKA
jgi:hypothetical protein